MIFRPLREDHPVPPNNLTIAQFVFDYPAEYKPIRPAGSAWLAQDGGEELKYDEATVRDRTDRLAYAIKKEYDLQEDEVVTIFSPNHIDYPIAIWATHRLYATVSTANPFYTVPELTYHLTHSKAKLIITHPMGLETVLKAATEAGIPNPASRVITLPFNAPGNGLPVGVKTMEELIRSVDAAEAAEFVKSGRILMDDEAKTKLAYLCFSSGTTGKPKAVCIPHHCIIANTIQMAEHVRESDKSPESRRYRPGDVVSLVLPFFHIFGLMANLHFPIFVGLTVLVTPRFNIEEFLKSIEKYQINMLFATPPHLSLLCNHPNAQKHDLSSVRHCMIGAAPLGNDADKIIAQFKKTCPNATFGQGYGLTESASAVLMPALHLDYDKDSSGYLIPGTLAKIVREDGDLAGYNEPGELMVAGPQIALGYFENAEATAETWEDGWLHTGDLVVANEDGGFVVFDRMKEVFKVRGFQVAPAELESHLSGHPDVADSCVFGAPDTFSGSVPFAYVKLKEEAAARAAADDAQAAVIKESIKKFVAENKVDYKWLDDVEFVDAIPRNPTGKILRRILAAKYHETRRAAKIDASAVEAPGTAAAATNGKAAAPRRAKKPLTDAEEAKLRTKTITILELDGTPSEFHSDVSLLSLGLDSLKATKLVHALRPYVVLNQGDMYGGMSYDDVVAFIRKAQAEANA